MSNTGWNGGLRGPSRSIWCGPIWSELRLCRVSAKGWSQERVKTDSSGTPVCFKKLRRKELPATYTFPLRSCSCSFRHQTFAGHLLKCFVECSGLSHNLSMHNHHHIIIKIPAHLEKYGWFHLKISMRNNKISGESPEDSQVILKIQDSRTKTFESYSHPVPWTKTVFLLVSIVGKVLVVECPSFRGQWGRYHSSRLFSIFPS